MEAGADAIFPEALNTAEMFRAFAKRMPGVPLLANMTEFGRTPFFTAAEFEADGLRDGDLAGVVAARRQQGAGRSSTPRSRATAARTTWSSEMQTRAELYDDDRLHDYEALDASIVQTIVPEGMPQS